MIDALVSKGESDCKDLKKTDAEMTPETEIGQNHTGRKMGQALVNKALTPNEAEGTRTLNLRIDSPML